MQERGFVKIWVLRADDRQTIMAYVPIQTTMYFLVLKKK